mgnify:CR=1 FL=1
MAEVYVTLGEAAELERVKYNTMVKRVLRKQESFVTKTEKSENGGKDVVLVAVSSLSKQARNAYSFGVEHTREFRVIWHEEHNLIFLDGTWSLDGSKIIDAWQKTEVL